MTLPGAVGQQHHAVVGRALAVDRDRVERVVNRFAQGPLSSGCGTAASVVMKPSMVAISGSIIPEPLAMPPIVISRPPIADARSGFLRKWIGRHDGAGRRGALICSERRAWPQAVRHESSRCPAPRR